MLLSRVRFSGFNIPVLLLLLVAGCYPAKRLVKPEMAKIPGGTFLMGDFLYGIDPDATPRHEIRVKPFYMMKYEVTYFQYDTLTSRFGWERLESDTQRGQTAAAYLTWDEAKRFCDCLGMRLPTEWEWEYAARSGGKNEPVSGTENPAMFRAYAHFADDPITADSKVGQKRPNGFGLFDMSGNVNEWTGRYYAIYDADKKNGRIPAKFKKTTLRIIRGGSFHQNLPRPQQGEFVYNDGLFTYKRNGMMAESRGPDVGFRCAKSLGLLRRLVPFL